MLMIPSRDLYSPPTSSLTRDTESPFHPRYLRRSSYVIALAFSLTTWACDDGGEAGLTPVGIAGDATAAGATAGDITSGGMTSGGMTSGGMTTGGMTTGGMTTGGMTTGGVAGGDDGGSTVVPPMDDAGRCFESCLALLRCQPSQLDSCGASTSAAFAATCQSACTSNTAAINAATAGGCGSESATLSALGLTCVDESLCDMAECMGGEVCDQGQCSVPACAPDVYDTNGNDDQERATELSFAPLSDNNLSLCNNDTDWYVIDIPANSSLRVDVHFQHSQADVDFKTYDEMGELLFSSASSNDNERITFLPAADPRRVWLNIYIYGTNLEMNPEMPAEPKSSVYELYLSTNLPVQICNNNASVCVEGEQCLRERGVCAPPPPCLSDDDCFSEICDIPSGRCIDCYADDDCYTGSLCNVATNECVTCLSNNDCSENETRNVCDPERSSCVECVGDTDCDTGVCNSDQRCIPSECAGAMPGAPESAIPLAWSGNTAEVSELFCSEDIFYVVTANGGENFIFTLLFTDEIGDLELTVTDPQGMLWSRTSSSDNEFLGYPNAIPGEYIIRVYSSSALSNPYTLRVEQSAELVCNSDDQCNGGTCDARESGICRPVGYCDANNDCNIEAPICDLTANRCMMCVPDALEPNDDPNSASSPPGPSQTLNTCGGTDYFKVTANPGQTINATVNFLHSLGDIDVKLYDSTGMQVDQSGGVSDMETLTYLVEAGGLYSIQVYGFRDVYNEYTIDVNVQ